MEEVVGSIPTRSTKYLYILDGADVRRSNVCVPVFVITLESCALGEGFEAGYSDFSTRTRSRVELLISGLGGAKGLTSIVCGVPGFTARAWRELLRPCASD